MNSTRTSKQNQLRTILSNLNTVIVAFSGGVDSTFLARIAKDACSKTKLVTLKFSVLPSFEINDSIELAKTLGLEHEIIEIDELEIPHFTENSPERCYYCKKYLFSILKEYAMIHKFHAVVDGTNADDTNDYRPGRKALKELGVISPLKSANLTKKEIRIISREMDLSTSSKPSYACLASRFPYGETLSKCKLQRAGNAEEKIRQLGFTQFRVRSHSDLARIEFVETEIDNAWSKRKIIERACKECGFKYIAIDTTGYRTGAMNEVLAEETIAKYQSY